MKTETFWQTKLHARLHDPAEKALVLLRDPEGHEGGTSQALHRDLGFQDLPVADWLDPDNAEVLDKVLFEKGIPIRMYRDVKRADWWAASADRPQWPMEETTVTTKKGKTKTFKVAPWAQVRWTREPILIHPLKGRPINLNSLADTDIGDIKERSFTHFSALIVKDGDEFNWRKTLLSFWRFGPELAETEDNRKLGLLWPLLPADTRVPDHSIWEHLDLTSAFSGAFAADPAGDAALLALSIGPVQSFIAAARSTSDLWAGSHLLSRLSWEAMKVVCERFGPDAVLFPKLRGVPQVDVWLRDKIGLDQTRFEGCDWTKSATDANPLFAAALPNRFVAVVPASEAAKLAADISAHVRHWLQDLGGSVVDLLLETAGLKGTTEPRNASIHAYLQVRQQLEGFPEVHWAAVPFSLIQPRNKDRQTDLDVAHLSEAMAPFFGAQANSECGFLNTPAWKVLQKETYFSDRTTFFTPNPGVLYPAIYELVERVLAAAKATRVFGQTKQIGWRCSLTGETEWLTTDKDQLKTSYRNQTDTLWAKISEKSPSLAKKGEQVEHLGALAAIKRLWPVLFALEVGRASGADGDRADRFVVSTHTMALAHQIDQWLEKGAPMSSELRRELERAPAVSLPRRLVYRYDPEIVKWARRLPGVLEAAAESEREREIERCSRLVRDAFAQTSQSERRPRIETYYGLLLMDGDNMGRILSGDDKYAISYLKSFHPQVREGFKQKSTGNSQIGAYGEQRRALSPNRHLAISSALNDFSLHVAPEIVEREYLGRLIYSGGDDVLAMAPVADLLPMMKGLRQAYSGSSLEDAKTDWKRVRGSKRLVCKDGFAYLRGKLMRMMGESATASCGAVVAHHQAPLSGVLRELREAEKRAKDEGGRDAFSVTIVKRSGGALRLTAKWSELDLLQSLIQFLAEPAVSRRAVYNTLIWLTDLGNTPSVEMLGTMLAYQLKRQTADAAVIQSHQIETLSQRLARLGAEGKPAVWLRDFLCTAEFLARECRVHQGASK